MKINKILVASAVVLMAGMSLASCNGGGNSGEADDGKIQISFWNTIGTNTQPYLEKYISEFEKENPNIEITNQKESSSYTEMADKAISGFTTDNYPDLIQVYPDSVSDFIGYNRALKLDEYMDNAEYGWTAEEKADVVAAYLEEGQNYVSEGTYSVPFSKSTEAMFYNKGVIIGLDLHNEDSTINNGNPLSEDYINNLTWEEFFDHLCPAIVAYNDKLDDEHKIYNPSNYTYGGILGYDSDDNLFITLCEQYGYKYTSVDYTKGKGSCDFDEDQGLKDLLVKWSDYAKKGYIISKGSAGNYTNYSFTAGAALFSVGSTGGVKYQFDDSNPMDVGVACISHAEGKDKKVISQGPSIAILKHYNSDDTLDTARAEAAWKFYKFMTNHDNALDWAINSGYTPIRDFITDDADFLYFCNEKKYETKTLERLTARNAKYAASVNDYLFTSPAFRGSSACRTQAGALMTYALTTTNDVTAESIKTQFANAKATAIQSIK